MNLKEWVSCNVDGKWFDMSLDEPEMKELRKEILATNIKRAFAVLELMEKAIIERKIFNANLQELSAWKITALSMMTKDLNDSINLKQYHVIPMVAKEKAMKYIKSDDYDKMIMLIDQNGGVNNIDKIVTEIKKRIQNPPKA